MAVTTTELGRRGEALALKYLKKQGYRPLAQNYRALHCEIDLILLDGETVVFVEVKARSGSDYGTPAEFVTRTKQQRIIKAATAFLAEQGFNERFCRFDIVEVYLPEGRIAHIPGAFTCDF